MSAGFHRAGTNSRDNVAEEYVINLRDALLPSGAGTPVAREDHATATAMLFVVVLTDGRVMVSVSQKRPRSRNDDPL